MKKTYAHRRSGLKYYILCIVEIGNRKFKFSHIVESIDEILDLYADGAKEEEIQAQYDKIYGETFSALIGATKKTKKKIGRPRLDHRTKQLRFSVREDKYDQIKAEVQRLIKEMYENN